ncbi:DUF1109 family protein [Paracoccus suum]|uniref:DUF1109 family protein n=1 Tax=Paracoccus suum TaxID=2259340 RepID=A0A344PNG1_9RHOB|nr:DUF1109 domain-containing protein [Paracoccus suum]AXC50916.1 DUF1109 family protein [Paracoccus suum]
MGLRDSMQTDMLIAAMAQDRQVPQAADLRRAALAWTLLALAAVAALSLVAMGLRPRLGWAMTNPPTMTKALLPLLVAMVALPAAVARARPEAAVPGPARWLLATLGLTAAIGLGLSLAVIPAAAWLKTALGHSALFCFVAIPLMSLPMLAALIGALARGGASTAPAVSGALAGLAAGGLAGAVYSLHCIEDAPLFFLVWYSLGVLVTAGLGALAGRRWLSW